ncbi:MAG: hypothetical protein ACRENM_02975, partial [Candidatus Dormibacteraceae bacterium]
NDHRRSAHHVARPHGWRKPFSDAEMAAALSAVVPGGHASSPPSAMTLAEVRIRRAPFLVLGAVVTFWFVLL